MWICVSTTCSQPTFCWMASITPTAATTVSTNGSHHDVLRRMSLNVAVGATNVFTTRSNWLRPRAPSPPTPTSPATAFSFIAFLSLATAAVGLYLPLPAGQNNLLAPTPAPTEKPPAVRREASPHALAANGHYIVTPPPAFFSLFSSLVLRAPMARLVHTSTWAISAFCAAALPQSRSALRRYINCRYVIASS